MDNSNTRIQALLGDKYDIRQLIQAGGMGRIFLGVHKALERKVAIKIMHEEWVKNEQLKSRFCLEARLAASLDHPGIIDIYDFGSSDDFDYIIMPFIEGQNLEARLETQGSMDLQEGTQMVMQIAEALQYAHSRNVIHRDIKPSNIMIDLHNKVIIADFGISKMLGVSDLTDPNMILGSPKYMSPEQIKGEALDARSDLYSLGLVFYEMLTGIHPFSGRETTAIYYAQVHETPQRPEMWRPQIPSDLGNIIMKLLSKSPENRHADADALLRDLRDHQQGWALKAFASEDRMSTQGTVPGDTPTVIQAITPTGHTLPADPIQLYGTAADSQKTKPGDGLGNGPDAKRDSSPLETLLQGPPDQGPRKAAAERPAVSFFGQHRSTLLLSVTILLLMGISGFLLFGLNGKDKTSEESPPIPPPPIVTMPIPEKHDSFLEALLSVGQDKTATDFSLWIDRPTYPVGDTIRFHFETGRSCYALILAYNTDSELVQIFPNYFSPDPFILPGKAYSIPDYAMHFDLQVEGPPGQETVIALVSDQPFQVFPESFSESNPFLFIKEKDARSPAVFKNIAAISRQDIAQKRLVFEITSN